MKCKTCHGKNEENDEFGSPWSESLGFKCGIPIMLGPHNDLLMFFHTIIEIPHKISYLKVNEYFNWNIKPSENPIQKCICCYLITMI